jgi:hypothetical protein
MFEMSARNFVKLRNAGWVNRFLGGKARRKRFAAGKVKISLDCQCLFKKCGAEFASRVTDLVPKTNPAHKGGMNIWEKHLLRVGDDSWRNLNLFANWKMHNDTIFQVCVTFSRLFAILMYLRRSQGPRSVRHELSSPTWTLGSWVRIPLEAWMSVDSVSVLGCV